MAKSIRRKLLEDVETALGQASVGGTTKPTGLAVHRFTTRPAAADTLPAQVVYLAREPTEERASGGLDRRLRFRVLSRVKVTAGMSGDDALDELLTWAEKCLTTAWASDASHTPFTSATAFKCTPQDVFWDAEERHEEFAQAVQEFEVHYQTDRGDPESQ